jgi:hypothetical protein
LRFRGGQFYVIDLPVAGIRGQQSAISIAPDRPHEGSRCTHIGVTEELVPDIGMRIEVSSSTNGRKVRYWRAFAYGRVPSLLR